MTTRVLLCSSALTLALLLQLSVASAQEEATCKIIWILKTPCEEPLADLSDLVSAWGKRKCGRQEKCMYEILEETPTNLRVMHMSTRSNETTEIEFDFKSPVGKSFCRILATSVSNDSNGNSPNDYCLIYNLMDGSGLITAPGSKQICNERMCPSMATARCKY
ncbi:wu:fc46h12 precursor [Scophthalmus maximus]|uniref:Wu:fc46h12 n=1 Tax=Scophthalmus maximus TaxID=52904 RepID=A0A2U9CAI5_SCOMX|nr:wu:fc46h12 precursor [Scophthalmus maximus]